MVRESLDVKGEAPREIEMRFTRHGPVLAQDAAGQRAFPMRSIWFEPGTSAMTLMTMGNYQVPKGCYFPSVLY